MESSHRKALPGDTTDSSPVTQKNTASPSKVPVVTKTAMWGVNWQAPTKMISLLLIGSLCAGGHHLFYQSLNASPVRTKAEGAPDWATQDWIIRYGVAFAFLAKTFLAAAVAIAYKQHIWINFRQQAYSVAAIDAIYDATTDLFSFLNVEMLHQAKTATFLALLVW